MIAKRVLVLVDWHPGKNTFPVFKKNFNEIRVVGGPFLKGATSGLRKVLFRWSMYIWVGIKAIFISRNYDTVIAFQPVCGIVLGTFYRLFNIKSKQLILLNMIFTERSSKFYFNFRKNFVQWVLKTVDGMSVYTTGEINTLAELFHYPKNRIFCVRQGIRIHEPVKRIPANKLENYIFSAGMSLRDYGSLIEAMRNLDIPLEIVCQPYNIKGLDIPDHIHIHLNLWGEEVVKLRRNARIVVIPLLYENISAGQYDILYSMSEGKAIIASRTVASTEHITDGKDGFLVPCRDVQALQDRILTLWNDSSLINKMGAQAQKTFNNNFTYEVYQHTVVNNLKNL